MRGEDSADRRNRGRIDRAEGFLAVKIDLRNSASERVILPVIGRDRRS